MAKKKKKSGAVPLNMLQRTLNCTRLENSSCMGEKSSPKLVLVKYVNRGILISSYPHNTNRSLEHEDFLTMSMNSLATNRTPWQQIVHTTTSKSN